MFTYGDGLGTVDIRRLLEFHHEQGRIGTVTGVHPTSRYGEIDVRAGRAVRVQREADRATGSSAAGSSSSQRDFFDYLTTTRI